MMIIKQGLSTEAVFNAVIKIFTLAGVKHERIWFPVTAEYLLRAETEQQALRPIVGALGTCFASSARLRRITSGISLPRSTRAYLRLKSAAS